MRVNPRALFRHVLLFVAYGALGAFVTLVVFFLLHLENRPDLQVWHTADLDEEFTEHSGVTTLEQYLRLEDRLFGQLERLVYDRAGPAGTDLTNRFKRGSLTHPGRWSTNWNRTFELPSDRPRAAVLLLHGLSDSPYSMRSIGLGLNRAGAHVLGLRVPGHGTAPSSLVTARWRDMAAAVELAVKDLAGRFPDQPLYIVGYSNGAALAVNYILDAADEQDMPDIDRLVLISPEIGVSALARFAVWQARLGHLLGLDKVAWNDILPEYDPFKYGSFAINAGDVSYRITAEIQEQISALNDRGMMSHMPPILAFSSVVDATVTAPDLVSHLFDRLPPGGHELVLYDINRMALLAPLFEIAPQEILTIVQRKHTNSFRLSLLTNADQDSRSVVVRTWAPGDSRFRQEALGVEWPEYTFSLSHVALPFPRDDPLYGGSPGPSPGISLGDIALRGERGALQVSPAAMLRQRWNPFFDYQQERILEFLSLQ